MRTWRVCVFYDNLKCPRNVIERIATEMARCFFTCLHISLSYQGGLSKIDEMIDQPREAFRSFPDNSATYQRRHVNEP